MKKVRVPIPKDLAAKVLFDSNRTCCVCRKEKLRIQLHHIDEDPSNNTYKNLAALCFDCHWETQILGGFDRKLDARQVELYRDDWLATVKKNRNDPNKNTSPTSIESKDYIEYEVNQDSVKSYSNSEVFKKAGIFVLWLVLGSIIALSMIAAAVWFSQPFVMFLVLPFMLFGGYKLNTFRPFFKMLFLPQNDEVDRYVDGQYVHKGKDGNYTAYIREAKCCLPNCEGIVEIAIAPPRERHKYAVIGKCSLDPHLHTYTVDFSGTGRFKEMDFRPLPSNPK